MDKRLELDALLREVLGSGNVYFQPPATIQMAYPAIVYQRDGMEVTFADNSKYSRTVTYQVTVIDENPDSPVVDRVADLVKSRHVAFFVTDGLNHDVFRLFF